MLVVHTYISHAISFVSLKMSDAGATSPAKKGKAKKKVEKKPAAHPTYIEMISAAIVSLKERSGSSRQAIAKYIKANYTVNDSADVHIKAALKRAVTAGILKQVKGTGASGSFKVAEKPKPKAKKPAAKKTPKKPAAKKTPKKKAPAKKTTTSAKKKKPVKKAAKKPAAKKPAAKKPAAKKAKKAKKTKKSK